MGNRVWPRTESEDWVPAYRGLREAEKRSTWKEEGCFLGSQIKSVTKEGQPAGSNVSYKLRGGLKMGSGLPWGAIDGGDKHSFWDVLMNKALVECF